MEPSHNAAQRGIQHEYGRKSTESPRLQKKRSTGRVRSENLAQQKRNRSANSGETDGYENYGYQSQSERPQPGQRKGSLRNVVRRIFGRSRSKEPPEALQTPRTSPPRHKYHKSEPPQLSPPQEQPEYEEYRDDLVPQRIFSAPLQIEVPAGLARTRSPYAVEFPQSARLKPLNLGNPFNAPGSTLRRRKTLPSILVATNPNSPDGASPVDPPSPPTVPQRPSRVVSRDSATPEIGVAVSGIKSSKRRSRSAGDLNWRNTIRAKQPQRKRSEEIQFWRESFHGSVLRASGFLVPAPQERNDEAQAKDCEPELKTPTRYRPINTSQNALHSRQATLGTLENSSPFDFRSNSALGTDMSRDLEDRVAKLESHLQSFQRSLQRLQAEKNRRTVVVGDYSQGERDNDARTPSMLADDLHIPREHAHYQYGYEPAAEPGSRPSTAPLPMTPTEQSHEPSLQPLSSHPLHHETHPSSSATATNNPRSRSSTNLSTDPDPSFHSLYKMLSDERSARRALEHQMRGLRTEIQDLHFQVQSQSRLNSTRNSYMLSHDASVGSARLRDLLRDTEISPNSSPVKDRDAVVGAAQAGVVSRFSGSTRQESEGGVARASREEQEEAQTPHDEYQTPMEGKSPFVFGRDEGGEMF